MSIYHDEVEIEDMEYDEETETYYYPCPCGDRFAITKVSSTSTLFQASGSSQMFLSTQQEDLENGEETATCPSCSLLVKVIYDKVTTAKKLPSEPLTGSMSYVFF